jgi:hypothetical protein
LDLAAALCVLPFIPLALTVLAAFIFGSGLERSPWYGNALGGADHSRWVAFGHKRLRTDYLFMEQRHVADLMNLILSACPMFFALPIAIVDGLARRRAEALFLLSGLLGLVLFICFWNADAGMRSDYDLFALFALPAYFLIALWWEETLNQRARTALALAAAGIAFAFGLAPNIQFP